MPRSERSKEASIIEFFRTADLVIAVLVMGLCKDALKERTSRSEEAKERAAAAKAKAEKEAKRVAAAKAIKIGGAYGKAAVPVAPAKVKKSHKKKPATPRLAAPPVNAVEDLGGDGDGYEGDSGD